MNGGPRQHRGRDHFLLYPRPLLPASEMLSNEADVAIPRAKVTPSLNIIYLRFPCRSRCRCSPSDDARSSQLLQGSTRQCFMHEFIPGRVVRLRKQEPQNTDATVRCRPLLRADRYETDLRHVGVLFRVLPEACHVATTVLIIAHVTTTHAARNASENGSSLLVKLRIHSPA